MYKSLLVSKTALDLVGVPKHYLKIPISSVIDHDMETIFEPIPARLNRRGKQNLFSKDSNYSPRETIPIRRYQDGKSYPTTPSKTKLLNFYQKSWLSGKVPFGLYPAISPLFCNDFSWNSPGQNIHCLPKLGNAEYMPSNLVKMRYPPYYTFYGLCDNRRIEKNLYPLTQSPEQIRSTEFPICHDFDQFF